MPKDRKTNSGLSNPVLFLLLAALPWGCAMFQEPGSGAVTYEGRPTAMGQGRAWAFVTLDPGGKPSVMGIRLSESALVGLPPEPPSDADGWEYVLQLPPESAMVGFDHIGIDWNPKGHIPPGVYDKAHIDFHFYLVSPEARDKITATGDDLDRAHKSPPEEFMAPGYVLPPGTEVPRMGAHAINPDADEFSKKSFTKTFIYGYYDGELIFVEPMITKAFLESKPAVFTQIEVPKSYPREGYYPTGYGVRYDAGKREYEISLDGLVYRHEAGTGPAIPK